MIFIQVILFVLVYIITLVLSYKLIEEYDIAYRIKWLNFPPFTCRKCFNFWSGLTVFIAGGLLFKWYVFMALGVIFQALTAISMHVDDKRKLR